MRGRLFFASTVTIGILVGFVFFIVLLASFAAGLISGAAMIVLTIVFSVISWLVSPWFTDLIHKWIYKFRVMEFDELATRSPKTAQFLTEACGRHKIKVPMLRILNDMNPTAYCYGSLPSNSRIVVSEGLFHYLTEDEVAAVYGHELGHIVNLDFIVMTVANTLLMILYEIYVIFTRIRSRGRNNPLPLIGLISLIFWWIGTYLVLYLSRTREYMADRFSGVETKNPNALATALVRIGYGIAAEPDTPLSSRLMGSVRSLNIVDSKGVDTVAAAVRLSAEEKKGTPGPVPAFDPRRVSRIFLFDIFNPWASIVQLGSTHPLTGKRIQALMGLAAETNQAQVFNFKEISIDGAGLDRTRLYGKFFFELLIYFAPIIGIVAGLALALFDRRLIGVTLLTFGLGLLTKGIYRFPSAKNPDETTVLELMSDPYASPLRGRPVIVSGTVIGKAAAGSLFGEDMVIHDPSGGLITLNYESAIPLFGNLFFGYKRVRDMINQRVSAVGWFRRKVSQVIDLKTIKTSERPFRSYTRFWALLVAVIITVIGIAATVASLAAMVSPLGPGGQGVKLKMNLPKVILPPAISLFVLFIIIYGLGSCMAAVPEAYRVRGPWVVETTPERVIAVTETGSGAPVEISLFSWGARFSQDDRILGTLKYERVNYSLRDSHNIPVWKMISHDTYVAVTDRDNNELFRIVRGEDRIEFVDAQGNLFSSILISGDSASLFSAGGDLLATTITTPEGTELHTPHGATMFVSDRAVSPAGLVAAGLPSFDRLERAALMIMVK